MSTPTSLLCSPAKKTFLPGNSQVVKVSERARPLLLLLRDTQVTQLQLPHPPTHRDVLSIGSRCYTSTASPSWVSTARSSPLSLSADRTRAQVCPSVFNLWQNSGWESQKVSQAGKTISLLGRNAPFARPGAAEAKADAEQCGLWSGIQGALHCVFRGKLGSPPTPGRLCLLSEKLTLRAFEVVSL